jgi:hypothetical protein
MLAVQLTLPTFWQCIAGCIMLGPCRTCHPSVRQRSTCECTGWTFWQCIAGYGTALKAARLFSACVTKLLLHWGATDDQDEVMNDTRSSIDSDCGTNSSMDESE